MWLFTIVGMIIVGYLVLGVIATGVFYAVDYQEAREKFVRDKTLPVLIVAFWAVFVYEFLVSSEDNFW